MFPFLDIALRIFPEIVSLITDEKTIKNAPEMKAAASEVVKTVTGAATPKEAEEKAKDPQIAAALRIRLAELAVDAQKVDAQERAQSDEAANASTISARQTLLELLNKPESPWVGATPSVISYIVIVGFFLLLSFMMYTERTFNDRILQILYICVGSITAGFATVLNFWLGSSLGSRRKDGSVALSGTVDKVNEITRPDKPRTDGGSPNRQPGGWSGGLAGTPESLKPSKEGIPPSLAGVARSTDPATVNHRKDIPPRDGVPASFRYNNPGAQYPSRQAARFGQVGFGVIGGGNKIAAFPSPVNGAAANLELLYRAYTGMTIGEAGKKWTGQNGFGVPGYDPDIILSKEMINDRDQAIGFMKAIARRESGKGDNLSEEQWQYAHDMFRADSADAFIAKFGANVSSTVTPVQPDGPPEEELAVLIVRALERHQYAIDRNDNEVNIIYIEGLNEDGSPNNDAANSFNDLRCVIGFKNNEPFMMGKWKATTEPGFYYDRDHPVNRKGAARIKFGQYKAWQVGKHRNTQEALRQVREITVHRDLNRDMQRKGDAEDTGLFGINQHGGYDMPEDNIGKASAGCLVGRTMAGHRQFMDIVKSDPRFVADASFVFATAVFPAEEVIGTPTS